MHILSRERIGFNVQVEGFFTSAHRTPMCVTARKFLEGGWLKINMKRCERGRGKVHGKELD